MRMKIFRLIVLVVITVLWSGNNSDAACSQKKDTAKKPLLNQSYFPIDVGYEWIYASDDGDVTFKVTGKQKVYRTECFIVKATSRKHTTRLYLSTTANGVRIHRIAGEFYDSPILLFRFPTKENDSWNPEGKVGDAKIRYEWENHGKAEITVPLGKFQAFKVAHHSDGKNGYFHLVKGIGVAEIHWKKMYWYGQLSGPITWKLKKFTKPSRAVIYAAKKKTKQKTIVQKFGAFDIRMNVRSPEDLTSGWQYRFAFYPPDKWLMERTITGIYRGKPTFDIDQFISDGKHLWFRRTGTDEEMNKRSKVDLKKLEQKVGIKATQQHMHSEAGFGVFKPLSHRHPDFDKVFGLWPDILKFYTKVGEEKINGVSTIKYESYDPGPIFSEIWFGKDDGIVREQTLYFWYDITSEVVSIKKGKEVDENDFKVKTIKGERVIDETDKVIKNILGYRKKIKESRDRDGLAGVVADRSPRNPSCRCGEMKNENLPRRHNEHDEKKSRDREGA